MNCDEKVNEVIFNLHYLLLFLGTRKRVNMLLSDIPLREVESG